jgi:fatty-acid desaturase
VSTEFIDVIQLPPLPPPAGVQRDRVLWVPTILVVGFHLIALLAFFPWFFSWTGVFLAALGVFLCGSLGISLCYHRLLAHRGFRCPKWLEHGLVILGVCASQDTPARWVSVHRRHHQHADEQPDPHSPLVSFGWAHSGWMFARNKELDRLGIYERYAKDILRDRFYKQLERNSWQLWIVLLQAALFFGIGCCAELMLDGTGETAVQFGVSLLVWGLFVRTVVVWHQTWSVNSVTHLWGYRNYQTDEGSRNNLLVGYLSNGEGWHNNHHADPRSAKYGHRWWELDTTWLLIRLLVMLGFAWDVVTPDPRLAINARDNLITRAPVENFNE